mmetsp:Transcript_23459/g.35675  ORF Transcript_23459/g.35675 Transcript_23459/m.35675 type:complete len:253 (+) Transcript_23459:39-797(+)|eukprot:CAMPEP_0196142268 /NCGR_PEP_ID=MMETSP0910-20130528/11454_1 /TAXON_ID=49265 /ORGANISM="Thalassiosira rotula, Strain GSO102" /LENGTH=252 /DNA_ID=CAMNT_0041403565 /DNA_START=45 /DNA_END=803 /DNA_ORIENTATION=+
MTTTSIIASIISLILLHLAPTSAMATPTQNAKATPKPTLGYWKIRGLASAIRYQLAYSNVPYDEEVYEQGDGPEFSRAAWYDVKHDQGLTYPNLPYLKDGSFSLTESGAIQRYCAKKWCPTLLCDDDMETYGKAEMAWGVVLDIKGFVATQCYVGDGDKKKLTDAAIPRFGLIAKELIENKFIIGDRICCADFAFVELVEVMDFISDGEIFKEYPSLKTYRDRVFELPRLKECLEEEKRLTFNNKVAKINNM